MNSFKIVIQKNRLYLLLLLIFLIFIGYITFRLSTLTGGMSAREISYINSTKSFSPLSSFVIFGPYNLIQYASTHLFSHSIFVYRMISVLVGLSFGILFYKLIKCKYGLLTAVISTFLAVTSAWFLHVTRSSTADVLFLAVILLFIFKDYLHKSKDVNKIFLLAVTISCIFLYVPGLIWFSILGIIWQRKILLALVGKIDIKSFLLIGLWSILLITPIIISSVLHPSTLLNLIGVPNVIPSPLTVAKNFALIPYNILLHMPKNSGIWLGTLPFLDLFSSAMFLIGVYKIIYDWKQEYSKILTITFIIGAIIYSFNGIQYFTIMYPIIYLLIASGIASVIKRWFFVFPRNPIPRIFGSSLLIMAVMIVFVYQTRSYFVAWPNHIQTRILYRFHP